MARTTIHLMRHGGVHNPEGILYGRLLGYHLFTLGHQMVQQVADILSTSGHDIIRVITSPLERAWETGVPTAAAFGLASTTDPRLIGAGNSLEGVVISRDRQILARPTYWSSYVDPLRPSWDEPYREIVECMHGAVVSTLSLAEGHEALLVSHQLPAWSLHLSLGGRPLAHDSHRRQCALASLTPLISEDHTLVGLAYWEPTDDLLRQARGMMPDIPSAQTAGSVSPVNPGSSVSPVNPAGCVEAAR